AIARAAANPDQEQPPAARSQDRERVCHALNCGMVKARGDFADLGEIARRVRRMRFGHTRFLSSRFTKPWRPSWTTALLSSFGKFARHANKADWASCCDLAATPHPDAQQFRNEDTLDAKAGDCRFPGLAHIGHVGDH